MDHHDETSDTVVEPASSPVAHETWFTVQEAVDATQSSRSTMKRRLSEQAFPNARQSDGSDDRVSGTWLIPKGDLLAAGFKLYAPTPPDQGQKVVNLNHEPLIEGSSAEVDQLRKELSEVQRRLDEERHAKELAEAIAAERKNQIDSLNRAMLILEAGPRPTHEPSEPLPVSNESGSKPRRKRWWQSA